MSRVKPKRGDIVDFDLNPTRGSETRKIRPCVVVSNDLFSPKLTIIQVVPITNWTEKKGQIITNVVLEITTENGLNKKSVADCLQTRPVDYVNRFIDKRGKISRQKLIAIEEALKIIFAL